jgi:methylenetetrahydrofolate reductase (NADPH)
MNIRYIALVFMCNAYSLERVAVNKRICDVMPQEDADECTYSFEFFPAKTKNGLKNLYETMEKLHIWNPLFIDLTWGAGGGTSEATLGATFHAQDVLHLITQMHITCEGINVEQVSKVLEDLRGHGINNIFALRGDRLSNEKNQRTSFAYASELVTHIRKYHGDFFHITVAGYPEGHPEAESYEQDLLHLKEKVDAGADMVITQMFFDTSKFVQYKNDCRKIGITCPIIPGIMSILSYKNFMRMIELCKINVPSDVMDHLAKIKDDDEAVKAYGVTLTVNMCRELHRNGVNFFHMYVLNNHEHWDKILCELEQRD